MYTDYFEGFNGELLDGEEILWSGQPRADKILSPSDFFAIPFSLLWGGFAIFWFASVIGIGTRSHSGIPFAFPLFGSVFVLVGLYMIFGRFIFKYYSKKATYYALTNKRILIITKLF